MVVSLISTAVFSLLEYGTPVLVSLIALTSTFNVTLAPIYFIHASETCVDVAIGFGSLNLYTAYTTAILLSSNIIDTLGIAYCFLIFGGVSFVGLVYIYFGVRDTTYGCRT